jgi:hypothetical protein
MQIHKSIVLGIAIAVLFSASAAFAFESSFGYGVFLQLIGNNAQVQTPIALTTQLQVPVTTAASSTGTLLGGPLWVEVVATSYTGTSSPSTEYATTTNVNEDLKLAWNTVPGATGYGIYISTTTAGNEQGILYATSSAANGINTTFDITSTSSVLYGVPSQSGLGFLTSDNSGTSTMATPLIQAVSNGTTTACTTALSGAQFYNVANSHLWLCTAGAWTKII